MNRYVTTFDAVKGFDVVECKSWAEDPSDIKGSFFFAYEKERCVEAIQIAKKAIYGDEKLSVKAKKRIRKETTIKSLSKLFPKAVQAGNSTFYDENGKNVSNEVFKKLDTDGMCKGTYYIYSQYGYRTGCARENWKRVTDIKDVICMVPGAIDRTGIRYVYAEKVKLFDKNYNSIERLLADLES